MSSRSSPARQALDVTVIALFLAGIGAPLLDGILRTDEARGPARENRQAAPKPAFALEMPVLTAYPERYESWYGDTFGLRDKLLRWNSIEKLSIGVSPTPKVLLGRDDWMFTTESLSFEVWRGLSLLRPDELEAWGQALERNRAHLESLGIEYLFVIGPNKETIYPERIPERLNRLGRTRLDQLAEHLREKTRVRFVDLRPALVAAKQHDLPGDEVYLINGTHWNGRGTKACYDEIVSALRALGGKFAAIEPMDTSRLERVHFATSGDNWARKMYVEDLWPQGEWSWRLLPIPRARTVVQPAAVLPGRKKVTEVGEPGLPRAFLVHDSFGLEVERLLAEHFSRLQSEWRYDFDTLEIEAAKPDVVIELFVERALVERSPLAVSSRLVDGCGGSFLESSDVLYRMEVDRSPPEITGLGETRCTPGDDGSRPAVGIRTTASQDPVVLPPVPLPADGSAAIFLDVTCPAPTPLVVFYKLQPEDTYRFRRSFHVDLGAGRNRVYQRLDAHDIQGPLAILPGMKAGDYQLHALEIRRLR